MILGTSVTVITQSNTVILNSVIETTPTGLLTNSLVSISNTIVGVGRTGTIIGMDVDVTNGYLYFGDQENGLYKLNLDSLSSEDGRTIVVSGEGIWGVAYDWINEYVYWTENT